LAWHNILEFTSVLISFTVFAVSYYTYEQTGNLRSVFLGSVFLAVGMVDAFHTLSYKGMPAFLIEKQQFQQSYNLLDYCKIVYSSWLFHIKFDTG